MAESPKRPTPATLAGDRILLTIPRGEGFENVAQLVLGGVAARLNLTYESLDDLGTALASLLERGGDEGELTVELLVGQDVVTATIGPFRNPAVAGELERQQDGVGLRRILETVVDSFGAEAREDGQWIELQKRIAIAGPA
ncbi:MAG TPA: hypothetical protein VF002_03035 [Gaiellaceae bacterium]